ncbi:polycystic kidney disease protein 1-like 2 [Microcaecilia unicolor]|uniref:Polycystic kidney disease protein 1-like 2 n=1 Tax=Microcaecilia unicolor TaxID=1415580 RepID=A0A6P7YCI0_9AMPH|nr:polycystic kidney disease protein 1-like 2 [Microcaecilia unicolor]
MSYMANWQMQHKNYTSLQEPSPLRKKRFIGQNSPLIDLLKVTSALGSSSDIIADDNITKLVRDITDMLQEDDEDSSSTNLVEDISLLLQLSEKLQDREARSSPYFQNLTRIAFFGTSSILQSVLSTCPGKTRSIEEIQSISNSSMVVLHNLEQATILAFSGSNSPVVVETPMFSLHLSSVKWTELGNRKLSFPDAQAAAVVFPAQETFQDKFKEQDMVQIQMLSFGQNPFPSHSSLNVTGSVLQLSLVSDHQELNLYNLTSDFQVFLPRQASATKDTTSLQSTSWSRENSLLLTINVTSPDSTLVIIAKPSDDIQLHLFLGPRSNPSVRENREVNHVPATNGSNQDEYVWIIYPETRTDPVGCQHFLVKSGNVSGSQKMTFNISTYSTHCAYWNQSSRAWRTDGCRVGPQTHSLQVQCLCNHLSFFGSSFFVLPAQVNVIKTAEYFSRVTENPVIVILVCCFFAIYILMVIWARKMDKKDASKLSVIILPDNDPCALYRYLVTVFTGRCKGASVNSKVFVTLSGSMGQSETRHLTEPKKKIFQDGSVDIFLLTTPFPLGDLESITLWHEASGSAKSWYVLQVVVQDLEQGQRWHFMCNAWLPLQPKGDEVTKTFLATKKQELTSFRAIFMKKTVNGLRNENIWISVLNHPAFSSFTRVQRVSCCLCLLLCTIVINLMFWEIPQGSYPDLIHIGTFSITWKDIMIGLESALLMFPVNLLIIYIFRNTNTRPASTCLRPAFTDESSPSPLFLNPTPHSLLKDLEKMFHSLRKAERNRFPELDNLLESADSVNSFLELLTQMVHYQRDGDAAKIQVTMTPERTSLEDLHGLYCGHYIYRKLQRVSKDVHQLGPEGFPDVTDYQQTLLQVQTLLQSLEKAAPLLQLFTDRRSFALKQKAKVQKSLPWWFIFIGWFLLLSISGISVYFSMMYGFVYGRQSSIRWIISMMLSLFQNIFILQPLKVVGFAIFFALVLKKVDEDEELDIEPMLSDLAVPREQRVIESNL